MSELSVFGLARQVLETASPRAKVAAARQVAQTWREGAATLGAAVEPPSRPARPAAPEHVPPGQVPRRRLSSQAGRTALLHAIAHIEFNAIDLAFDMVARFGTDALIGEKERRDFVSDWIGVGEDEARHFTLLADRLESLGSVYGALPAHGGLWDAAEATAGSLPARLAVAPLVLEARGLDVTPGMIDRLESADDRESAEILRVIYEEEVGHVAAGMRWFQHVCDQLDQEPAGHFRTLVRRYYKGTLKPPFNIEARLKAKLTIDFYGGLS